MCNILLAYGVAENFEGKNEITLMAIEGGSAMTPSIFIFFICGWSDHPSDMLKEGGQTTSRAIKVVCSPPFNTLIDSINFCENAISYL